MFDLSKFLDEVLDDLLIEVGEVNLDNQIHRSKLAMILKEKNIDQDIINKVLTSLVEKTIIENPQVELNLETDEDTELKSEVDKEPEPESESEVDKKSDLENTVEKDFPIDISGSNENQK